MSENEYWAAAIEARAEEVYPRDVFIPPTKEDFAAINDLLQRERGHQLDGVAAECYRRAYASIAAQIRAGTLTAATYNETRFACRCGRFLADSAIRTTTHRDDSRYYGIRDEIEWDCGRCGTVKGEEWEPQIVITATRTFTPDAPPHPASRESEQAAAGAGS